MIERKFVAERMKEFQVQEYIDESLSNVGHSHTKMQRTPLGEKIVIFAARPGLIVGRKGENIKKLTKNLKKKFGLENPQIEISEVENIFLDAKIVAEKIASTLERFGPQRFKGVGHKTLHDVMGAGARGIEILISGKIPGARAKTWRFYQGYLKKCGDVSITAVKTAYARAVLKTGVIGIRIKIMSPDFRMPDDIQIRREVIEEEVKEEEKKKKKDKKKSTKEEKEETPAEQKKKQKGEAAPKPVEEKKVEKPAEVEEKKTEKKTEEKVEEKAAEKPVEEEVKAEEKKEEVKEEEKQVEEKPVAEEKKPVEKEEAEKKEEAKVEENKIVEKPEEKKEGAETKVEEVKEETVEKEQSEESE